MRVAIFVIATVLACATVHAQAPAPAHPILIIQSAPGGVQVYVDDELLGTTSPEGRLKVSTLKPGKHTLRVSLGSNSYGEGQFTLVAGKSLTKTVTAITAQPQSAPPTQPVPATQPAQQQSGPTLSETIQWIGTEITSSVMVYRATAQSEWCSNALTHSDFQADPSNACALQWQVSLAQHCSNDRSEPTQRSYRERLDLAYSSPTAFVKEYIESKGGCQLAETTLSTMLSSRGRRVATGLVFWVPWVSRIKKLHKEWPTPLITQSNFAEERKRRSKKENTMKKFCVAPALLVFCGLSMAPRAFAQTDAQQCVQHFIQGQGKMAEHVFKNSCNYRIGTLYEDNDSALGGSTGNGAMDPGGTQFGGMAAYSYRMYACKWPGEPMHASGQPG